MEIKEEKEDSGYFYDAETAVKIEKPSVDCEIVKAEYEIPGVPNYAGEKKFTVVNIRKVKVLTRSEIVNIIKEEPPDPEPQDNNDQGGSSTVEKTIKTEDCERRVEKKDCLRALLRRIRSYLEKPRSCPICQVVARNSRSLEDHVRIRHKECSAAGKESQLECAECGMRFEEKDLVKRHMKRIHLKSKGRREKISSNNYLTNLKKTLQRQSSKTPLVCQICREEFAYVNSLAVHIESHESLDDRRIVCPFCSCIVGQNFTLRQHVAKYHPKFVSSKNSAPKTMNMNFVFERMAFFCNLCGWISTCQYFHDRHMARHSKPAKARKVYECETCHWKYDRRDKLRIHMLTHGTEKPYVCDVCNKAFHSSFLLKRHKLIHNPEPRNCLYCKKIFNTGYGLQMHLANVHRGLPRKGGSDASCTICKKHFQSMTELMAHTKIHKFQQCFICALCGVKVRKKYALQRHMENFHMHKKDSEDKHKCDVCQKTFNYKYNLQRHLQAHSKTKPFPCKVCNRKFKFIDSVKSHMEEHEVLKGSAKKCFYCTKCYDDKSTMRKHVRLKHPGLPLNTAGPPFRCAICREDYLTMNDLKEHVKEHRKFLTCGICKQTFKARYNLKLHVGSQHRDSNLPKVILEKCFECSICGKKFDRRYPLKVHAMKCVAKRRQSERLKKRKKR